MTDSRVAEPSDGRSGWEKHQEDQLKRLANLPLAEKLTWLEEAQRLVEHLKAQQHRTKS
jgi:hypothetical protein